MTTTPNTNVGATNSHCKRLRFLRWPLVAGLILNFAVLAGMFVAAGVGAIDQVIAGSGFAVTPAPGVGENVSPGATLADPATSNDSTPVAGSSDGRESVEVNARVAAISRTGEAGDAHADDVAPADDAPDGTDRTPATPGGDNAAEPRVAALPSVSPREMKQVASEEMARFAEQLFGRICGLQSNWLKLMASARQAAEEFEMQRQAAMDAIVKRDDSAGESARNNLAATRPIADPRERGLLLRNKGNYGLEVRFLLNGREVELAPGESRRFDDLSEWKLEFHRGGDFGYGDEVLAPGGYEFFIAAGGWTLARAGQTSSAP